MGAMIGFCAIGIAVLLLLGLLAAWAGGAFSPAQPNQHQQSWYQQAPPQPQTQPAPEATQTEPAESEDPEEDVESDPTPPVTEETSEKPVTSTDDSDETKLKRYWSEVMAMKKRTGNYKKLKPILNWIRLRSKWGMRFQNNIARWEMDHNIRWGFGGLIGDGDRGAKKDQNERSIKSKALSISRQNYMTLEDVEQYLWLGTGWSQEITDIFIEGERVSRKWRKIWNETTRQTWVQFWSYYHNVEELMLAVTDRPSVDHSDATGTPKRLGPPLLDWYVTDHGDYVWPKGNLNYLPKNVRHRLKADGFIPGRNKGKCSSGRGSIYEYLRVVKQVVYDKQRLFQWGNMEYAQAGVAVLFGLFFCVLSYLVGLSNTCIGASRCFFIPFAIAMVFSFW